MMAAYDPKPFSGTMTVFPAPAGSAMVRTADPPDPLVPCPLLAALFPAGGVVGAALHRPGDPQWLLPEEREHMRQAVAKRVQEFAAGRHCARAALRHLGVIDPPLPVNDDRTPRWPPGVVGSISHTEGYCGAVVAHARQVRGIGIDAEVASRVPEQFRDRICTREELTWIDALPRERRADGLALAFAAKEAAYKCQFPITGNWLDFRDVAVTPDDAALGGMSFSLRLVGQQKPAPQFPTTGRFVLAGRLVLAGVMWMPPPLHAGGAR
jgi:4'-phosphopantetheinyl transferase EntD